MAQIEGMNELVSQMNRLKGLDPHAMLAAALVLQKYAMQNAPVVTGFLRGSASSYETEKGAALEFSADYAYYVEFGTSTRPARAYVRRAIDEHSDEAVKAAADQIQKDIEGKVK